METAKEYMLSEVAQAQEDKCCMPSPMCES